MAKPKLDSEDNSCFVIMPISEMDGYPSNHFSHVYNDIIVPAVGKTRFAPLRADQVQQTNLIHTDILTRLIEAPMAVCDLSSRNPNVLFELGIRQAFDKPVVLIQEEGTPKIFDISVLRILNYSREMKYHDVLKTQEELAQAIEATEEAVNDHKNINSLVKLIALGRPASVPTLEKDDKGELTLDIIQSQLLDIRKMMEHTLMSSHEREHRLIGELRQTKKYSSEREYMAVLSEIEEISRSESLSNTQREKRLLTILERTNKMRSMPSSPFTRGQMMHIIELIKSRLSILDVGLDDDSDTNISMV